MGKVSAGPLNRQKGASHHVGRVDLKPGIGALAFLLGQAGNLPQEGIGIGVNKELEQHLIAAFAPQELHRGG